jgi:aminoglycoside phosphotransferase (APT) family kinase protein
MTAELDWLTAVEQRYGGPVRVVESRPLGGGYVSADVRRIELDVHGAALAVVLKRTTCREVTALRALAAVPGLGGPELIAAGGDGSAAPWVLMPYYPGLPPAGERLIPSQVYDTLAQVHAWHLRRPPRGLTRVDAAFWRRLCVQVALPAVEAAARAGAHNGYEAARALLPSWAEDARMAAALRLLPVTLVHGDMHRGNILTAAGQTTVIDWGNARIAPGGLDVAVLGEQGGTGEDHYRRRLAELTGRVTPPELVEVERHWAVATGYTQYLAFAAEHLGGDRVGVMVERAARAFTLLGTALARLV